MKFKNLLFSIILVNEYFSVSICINIKNANHINLTFNEYPITNNIPIDIPNTLEPVSPIIAFAFKYRTGRDYPFLCAGQDLYFTRSHVELIHTGIVPGVTAGIL